ncbi:MAG: type II toxin-antitoxin system prevent-host-death family antitoxin [Thermus sp.]|uniref:type II toxin-antitoxin system Phd/YefM family antitoxin n=1 Tax=Thermus sp. TaxID=275 RepID=UPI00351BBA9D
MRTVTLSEAEERLLELIRRVRAGEEVLILEGGVPIARLVPPEQENPALLRLERRGLVRLGTGRPQLEDLSLPTSEASVLQALLEEREEA